VPESLQEPRQRGERLKDAVQLFVNQKIFDGWKSVNISFNMDSIAGRFSLTFFDRFFEDEVQWAIKPNDAVHIHIGQESVFTGFAESLNASVSSSRREVSISGRTNAGDLVDSSHVGPSNFTDISLPNLIRKLIEPFNIELILSTSDVGAKFEEFTVKQNETVWDALKRATLMRGLLLISTANGNIELTRRGSSFARTALEQGENITQASSRFDNSDRFSQYIVKSQRSGGPNISGRSASENEGQAFDDGIMRNRPTVIISESSGDSGEAKKRAQWEASLRAAEALEVKCTTVGWRQEDESLWKPNQLVRFKSGFLGINSQMLIKRVQFLRNLNEGTLTNLTLVRPDAFELRSRILAATDPGTQLEGF